MLLKKLNFWRKVVKKLYPFVLSTSGMDTFMVDDCIIEELQTILYYGVKPLGKLQTLYKRNGEKDAVLYT